MIDVRYWIWLSIALNQSFKNTEKIINAFSNAKDVYNAEYGDYIEAGLSEDLSQRLCDKSTEETNSIYSYCNRNGVVLIPYDSPSYPSRLKKISSPPILLYCRGTLPDIDDNVCIATVGTRRITDYGRREAYTICYDLASAGAVVVSGLARGVDSICHRASLDAGGRTIAVIGSGIDVVYPKENDELYAEICSNGGAVITEFIPGTPPLPQNFPTRNRIISGMSLGTLVLEADSKSGALITARQASAQGRDIFSLPGKVGELNSIGTNNLIKEGAKMITSAVDVLEEYECLFPHRIRIENIPVSAKKFKTSGSTKPFASPLPEAKKAPKEESKVSESTPIEPLEQSEQDTSSLDPQTLKILMKMKRHQPITLDELVDDEIGITEIMIAMTMLEIGKFVSSLPGGRYVRN